MNFNIKREYLIGFIVVFITALFLWGVYFLKNQDIFSKRSEYVAVYDKVSGLLNDNPVVIKGIRVGKVKELGFLPGNSNKVFVKIILLKKINIPDNSTMLVVSSDLLGAKAVEIVLGNSNKFAKSGDTLASKITKSLQEEVNSQVLPIKLKAEQLMSSFDTLLTSIRSILNSTTQENLRRSFEDIRLSIKNIQNVTYNIDTLVDTEKNRIQRITENIESITNNFKSNNEKLSNIINNFSSLSDSLVKVNLVKTIHNADRVISDLAAVTDKINKGKGSIGMLINNDSLYINVQKSADELKKLFEDMRLNPNRYVHFSLFGGKAQKYTEPKK